MLRDGAAVVNISELARRTGYSRPTIYRALIFFTRFGKVRQIQAQRTGKRRPGIYTLNPAYLEEMRESATAEEKGVSAASVNLSYKALQEDQETNQLKPSTGPADPKTTSDKKRLTGWLAQADVNRPPTARERRKLSVAIRLMISQDVANPLLDALWWRTKAPLRLWRVEAPGAGRRQASLPRRPGTAGTGRRHRATIARFEAMANSPGRELQRRASILVR